MTKNIKIPLSGDLRFPRGAVTRREGRVVLPAVLDSPANAAIDLVLVSTQTVGAVSFSVSTRVVDPDGIHYAPVLFPDVVEDRSVPQEQRDTFILSFAGGDLANVTGGAVLLVEIVRYGGTRRVQTEADCELLAAYLRVEVPDGGGEDGEANTVSNVGSGAGVFKEKVGVDLRFKSLLSVSDALLVGVETDHVELDFDPAEVDHGVLSGLAGDDHPQYALLAARSGGQTLIGDTDSLGLLSLKGSSHADGGFIELNNDVIVPTSPDSAAVSITPVIRGSVNAIGLRVSPAFEPSGSASLLYGLQCVPNVDPGSGVTVSSLFSHYYRTDFLGNDGAVTNANTLRVGAPQASGTLKPSNQYGLYIENQALSGMTQAVGLYVENQAGATGNICAFFGGDVLHDSGAKFRMAGQNRFRYLNMLARASSTGATIIPNNAFTAVSLGGEIIDTDTMHDNSVNNSRITVKIAGKYLIVGVVDFEANGTGIRGAGFQINGGGGVLAGPFLPNPGAGNPGAGIVAALHPLNANDYVELMAYQNSGGNLNTHVSSGCYLCVFYAGE